MPYTHSIELCLEEVIGARGLPRARLACRLEAAAAIARELKAAHAEGALPLLALPARRDDLAEAEACAAGLARGASDILVLATGGSSLGGKALSHLAGPAMPGATAPVAPAPPRLYFLDNLDPASLEFALRRLDLKTTRFLVISKSGNTPETVMQMLAAIEALKAEGLDWNIAGHLLAISEPAPAGANAVRHLAGLYDIPVLDHDPELGGRFSVLSVTGAVPAFLMGLDPVALRQGAAEALAPLLETDDPAAMPPVAGAAVNVALAEDRDVTAAVLMAYADGLAGVLRWWVQLWAESLGKDGHGTTPVPALGPADQHSQLQMFLDGPADKLVTVIGLEVAHAGPALPDALAKDPLVGYLAGKTVGDLVDCEQRATVETLAEAGRPVRSIGLPALDERAMGALFMHFMLETIVAGRLLGVDVFGQPAVEAGKRRARAHLESM